MTVLLTRPKADSQRIADELMRDGIGSAIWPLTEIIHVEQPILIPERTDGLVFTSSHGVRAFAACNARRDLRAYCVGDRTAALARDAGFAEVLSASGDFEALVKMIRDAAPNAVLYPRAQEISADLEAALRAVGIRCNSEIVYSAQPSGVPDAEVDAALVAGAIDVMTIWSRRNASLLGESLSCRKDWKIDATTLIGISENAVRGLGNAGFRRIIVASRPNATQMVAEIRGAVR